MFETLIALLAFVSLACGLLAAFRYFFMPRMAMDARLRSLTWSPDDEADDEDNAVLRRSRLSIPGLRGLLTESPWIERWGLQLEQADLRLRPTEYLLVRSLCAALFFAVSVLILRQNIVLVPLAFIFGFIGFQLPAFYVGIRRQRRIVALDRQLVEMVRLISNSLRSGFAFMQGVDAAAKQLKPPLSTELQRLLADMSVGANTEEALQAMSRRIGSYDLDMIVTGILIQRATGGNLSEVLDHIGETMRERDRLRGEVRALTAQQRFTGTILAIYPAALALLFFALNPDMMSLLWETSTGLFMLGVAGVLQVMGFLLMRRILAIEVN
jgi:tight adherence protein B